MKGKFVKSFFGGLSDIWYDTMNEKTFVKRANAKTSLCEIGKQRIDYHVQWCPGNIFWGGGLEFLDFLEYF